MGSCKSLQNFPSLYRNIFQYESKAPLSSVLRHCIESAYVPWPFLARLTAHIYSFMRVSQSVSLPYTMVGLHSLLFSIFFFFIYFTSQTRFLLPHLRLFFHFPSALSPSTFSLFLFREGKASHVSQQSTAYQVEEGSSSCPLHQGWTRYPIIGDRFQRASSCVRYRYWSHF